MRKLLLTCLIPAAFLMGEDNLHDESAYGYVGYFGDRLSKHYFHPCYHWAISFSDLDQTITLEDGSVWRIDPAQFRYITDWRKNDPLTLNYVAIDRGWLFSDCEVHYALQNQADRKHAVVKAIIIEGPKSRGKFSRHLMLIDGIAKTITLTDRTRWYIPNLSFCGKWLVGDPIIVALDKDNKPVLLNINLKEETKASLRKWIYGEISND